MAFKFNFTSQDLGLEDVEDPQEDQLRSSLGDLSLDDSPQKIPCRAYNISASPLPSVIQADRLDIESVERSLYKRTLADVKFQMAQQDTIDEQQDDLQQDQIMSMLDLSGKSDLIRGVYEGGFKTWECSVDLVQFLASLPAQDTSGKKIIELGCGSALPSLYLLAKDLTNKVDVQDYNEQVIRFITIPNILLNTVLSVYNSEDAQEHQEDRPDEEDSSDEETGEEKDEEEKDQIIGDSITCDAEAEVPADKREEMLRRIGERSQAFTGDWSGLPDALDLANNGKYDMIVTSETIYAEHALPDLLRVFQRALKKPSGVAYVAAKTVYFGVGGGILPFCDLLTRTRDADGDLLKAEKVYESDSTVKREILKVAWDIQ